jgi:hypothetical protein
MRVRSLILLAGLLATVAAWAQNQTPQAGGVIQGIVLSQQTPIPGALVTATNSLTEDKASTTTDLNGRYSLRVPATGAYIVEIGMPAFSSGTKEANVTTSSQPVRLDFELSLLSRSQQASAPSRPAVPLRNRGAQNLPALRTENAEEDTSSEVEPIPEVAPDAPTESVAIQGNTAENLFGNNATFDRERIQQLIDERFGGPAGQFGGQGGPGGPVAAGGPGGFGGRGGGPGGGGGGGFAIGGGRGGFRATRPRGNISYTLGDSALDAAPYSLTGQPAAKPSYLQNRFSASIGGPLKIPKIYSSNNTAYTVTYNGSHASSPYDVFSTVPTLAERLGDFSQTLVRNGSGAGTPVQIFDPQTHSAFPSAIIPSSMINPAAAGLLAFIPTPNLPGDVQNFHYVTAVTNNSDDVNIRLNHTFGAVQNQRGARGGPGGPGGFGGRGGFGRGGVPPGGAALRRPSNLNFGLQYRSATNILNNPFPSVSGQSLTKGLNVTLGYTRSIGRIIDNLRVNYNRNRTSSSNLYAFRQDIAGTLGINGVSRNPFDWGIPNLSFTNFTGLNDIRPSLRRDETIQIGNGMIWNRGKHVFRWGGDFRLIQNHVQTNQNARGSFTFTGVRTGFDLSDFLLGLPQLTSLQYGNNSYNFQGNSWDLYLQDDWRLRPNLTFNLGLRYEYVSPFTERDNRIVNLDVAPGFTAVAPALPGSFPRGLVNPDRNNWAPRIGIAWRATNTTVVRAGYSINYNTGAYAGIVQQLAFQPPFSNTQTNIVSPVLPLTLQDGFPSLPPATITNNFGVDPDYRLGYVQIWNFDIQREIQPAGLVLNLDYTGTKGAHLDILQAPNRTATGLRIPDVQPFTWESSAGNSIMNAVSVRLRRRLQRGVSVGSSYTFSKSIDNASSIGTGGGTGVVAQDAFNLAAERGLSSFDQTHRLNVDYVLELPLGHDKHWFSGAGIPRVVFGDWQFSGSWSLASGTPFTARVLGSFTDVNRGTNGSLRADATGLPLDLSNPTATLWFNTAAFAVPAPGQFGNVGRNTIRGPATSTFNMSLNKLFPFVDGRSVELRIQGSNIFNTPQFRSIDTIVNSPSFGRVTSVGSMRKIQITARFRF